MEKQNKGNSGLFAGIFCAIAGIALGIGGKVIYDEITKDEKIEAENKAKALYKKKKSKDVDTEQLETNETDMDAEYESFFCPISLEIMKDPVITPKGISFDKKAILNWLEKNSKCPITKTELKESDLITNYALKCTIDDYLKKQKMNGNTKKA